MKRGESVGGGGRNHDPKVSSPGEGGGNLRGDLLPYHTSSDEF